MPKGWTPLLSTREHRQSYEVSSRSSSPFFALSFLPKVIKNLTCMFLPNCPPYSTSWRSFLPSSPKIKPRVTSSIPQFPLFPDTDIHVFCLKDFTSSHYKMQRFKSWQKVILAIVSILYWNSNGLEIFTLPSFFKFIFNVYFIDYAISVVPFSSSLYSPPCCNPLPPAFLLWP